MSSSLPISLSPYPLLTSCQKNLNAHYGSRFGLPEKDTVLGLPVGQHIAFRFKRADGEYELRDYTPTSSDDELGYVDFVIKVYRPHPPKFPEGGRMSQYLQNMKVGEMLEMMGPKGHIHYKGSVRRDTHYM
jgi:cytochrome-b5 reductase